MIQVCDFFPFPLEFYLEVFNGYIILGIKKLHHGYYGLYQNNMPMSRGHGNYYIYTTPA